MTFALKCIVQLKSYYSRIRKKTESHQSAVVFRTNYNIFQMVYFVVIMIKLWS